MAVGKRIT